MRLHESPSASGELTLPFPPSTWLSMKKLGMGERCALRAPLEKAAPPTALQSGGHLSCHVTRAAAPPTALGSPANSCPAHARWTNVASPVPRSTMPRASRCHWPVHSRRSSIAWVTPVPQRLFAGDDVALNCKQGLRGIGTVFRGSTQHRRRVVSVIHSRQLPDFFMVVHDKVGTMMRWWLRSLSARGWERSRRALPTLKLSAPAGATSGRPRADARR